MFHATKGYLAAQIEVIMLHVDLISRKVTPFPPEIFDRIKAVQEAHSLVEAPKNLGDQCLTDHFKRPLRGLGRANPQKPK